MNDDLQDIKTELKRVSASLKELKDYKFWRDIFPAIIALIAIVTVTVISLTCCCCLDLEGWEVVTVLLGVIVSSTWAFVAVVALRCKRDQD